MIALARKLNRYPNNAEYICTAHTGLESLPAKSFQLIYSNIVLQHVVPDVAVNYLHEFFRLLEPGGLLVFQLPSHATLLLRPKSKPMPDAAYRAGLALAAALPPSVEASSELSVALTVRNASAHAWQQPHVGPLAVGNHWLDASGELMLVQDDGRAPLLQMVPAGLEWPVLMTIHAPAEPGMYVGEIDLVHEGITWYGHRGSPTLRFTIEVTRGSAGTNARPAMIKEYPVPDYPDDVLPKSTRSAASSPQANFPMHGVPRETVMDLINQYGARLAYLEEDRRAGPEWVSYRYFVVGKR
jgi:hypothetical protein